MFLDRHPNPPRRPRPTRIAKPAFERLEAKSLLTFIPISMIPAGYPFTGGYRGMPLREADSLTASPPTKSPQSTVSSAE